MSCIIRKISNAVHVHVGFPTLTTVEQNGMRISIGIFVWIEKCEKTLVEVKLDRGILRRR